MIIAVSSLRQSVASVPWGFGRCGAVEFRVPVPPLTRMAAERAEHEQARARMPLLPAVLRGFGGRLAHRVLHGVDVLFGHRALRGVDVLGRRVKRGVGERLGNHVNQGFGGRRHRGVSALRALTAAMRIARKRNRSPQNGAGRDDGSSQRSLL